MYQSQPEGRRFAHSAGMLIFITAFLATVGNGAGCDCGNLRGVESPGSEVCGVDGLKYGSACLAECQGIEVSDDEACAPGFALAVGGHPGGLLDQGVISRFADKGMRYLGEEADGLDEGQGGSRGGVKKFAVTVDLVLVEDGAVYGRPLTTDIIEAGKAIKLPKTRSKSGVLSRRMLGFFDGFVRFESIYKDNFKDDRAPVPDTDSDPWRRIGVVEPAGCTGVLVAPNKVLTAAHCIVSSRTNGIRGKIRFAPAKNNDQRPYGTFSTRFSRVQSCFQDNDVRGCDIGVITLTSSLAGNRVGWFEIGSDCTGQPANVTIAGYPGDKDVRTMWFENCGETEIECKKGPQLLQHTCDVAGGMSGAPIWDTQGKIRGVHSGWSSVDGIIAAQITPETYGVVKTWIDE